MQSLNARLMFSAGVWIALVLVVGGFALSFAFKHAIDDSFQRRLEASVNTLVAATDIQKAGQLAVTRSLGDAKFEQALSGWYWQVSTNDEPLARSRSLWDENLPLAVHVTTPGEFGSLVLQGPRDRTLWASFLSLQIDGFPTPVQFMVAGDVSDLIEERKNFDFILSLSLIALGIGVLLALVIQIRYGLKPLRGLVQDLENIRQHKANRLDTHYPEEIQPLIQVTNAVLEENQSQIERARRHVGNLAHALKTPLTLLRGETRTESDTSRKAALNNQIDAIANLVEHHLARAAAAGSSSFTSGSVPVHETVISICRSLEKIYAAENRRGHIDVPGELVFRGGREDLEEIAGNIIENAFKWARKDIHVSASARPDGLHLVISDDGPGMPEAEMEQALLRGQRLDEMTPGHGLGLSIVTDLVALYQGRMAFGKSPAGGLAVTIVFPPDRMA